MGSHPCQHNEAMTTPITVLIADDHPVVRGGLAALLSTLPGIEVVAQAGDGDAALREATLLKPDVAILDLRMPRMDGVETTRRITAGGRTAVLVLSMVEDSALIREALAAGARGYLVKGAEPDEIEQAVRAVASGSFILSRDVADRVLGGDATSSQQAFPQLTTRERDVLELISRGLGNAAISQRLDIAAKTVGNHISSIFLKLGVATRAEAIAAARDAGVGA
jgi:DNA-binding NarL/FixJ family response regulator